jgi:ribosomal protein L7/L12
MTPTTELPPNVVNALSKGRKIEAIKLLRDAERMDLKDAKETVEAYAQSRPEMSAALETASREGVARLLRWALVAVAAFVMWYWLRGR